MTKTAELCNAILIRNDSEVRKLINEMTTKEVNATYEYECKDQNKYFFGKAIHLACLVNNTNALNELLCMKGINVNSPGVGTWGSVDLYNYSYTPLMVAAKMKHMESFDLLLKDESSTVGLEADMFKELNQENHAMLIKLITIMQKNYQELRTDFAYIHKKLKVATVTVTNSDMLRTTDLEVLKVHENNFGKFLESGEMTDFRIICGEETFHCHKNILFAQSNVFKTMFNNDMKESREDSMTITDLEPTIVKMLLKFIYTGTVDLEEIESNTIELLQVADKYELDGLTKLCENNLVDTIENDNVLDMIMKADLYHADRLKEVAMKWIVANKFEIVKQEGWKEVLKKFPCLMTDMLEALTTKPTSTDAETCIPKITEFEILRAHGNNFERLMENRNMSDFRIISVEETFHCHKNILLAQTNILGAVSSNGIGVSMEDFITISDLEPVIIKLLLKFIYTGTIGNEEAKENANKLLEIADRYNLNGLTKVCENELMSALDNNNVLEMITKADLYHADKLRKYAMKWIVANKADVVKQEGWKESLLQFPILIDMLEVLTKKY